jgi:chromosome segregation ATPase
MYAENHRPDARQEAAEISQTGGDGGGQPESKELSNQTSGETLRDDPARSAWIAKLEGQVKRLQSELEQRRSHSRELALLVEHEREQLGNVRELLGVALEDVQELYDDNQRLTNRLKSVEGDRDRLVAGNRTLYGQMQQRSSFRRSR